MSWFKQAKNFNDRNTMNAKIRYLESVRGKLEYLSKFIFQSGKNAKEVNYKIITSDKITSYPSLHETLIEADCLALDSPWKFANLCNEAIGKIDRLIMALKKERESFIRGESPQPLKGWVD